MRQGAGLCGGRRAGLFTVVLLTVLPAVFAGPAAAASSTRSADHLTLVRQSPWVGPNAPNQDLTMGLQIRSSAARQDLTLQFTVYKPLTSRSEFVETLSGRGLGTVAAQSPPVPVSGLTTDGQGVTHVTIPVDGDTTPPGPGDWTADLRCALGSCANVYPVKVTLTDSSAPSGAGSGPRGPQLVTYLVYNDPSPTSEPLRFALVMPLGLAPPAAGSDGRVPALSPSSVATLEGLLGALEGSPSVPVTLLPDPATLGRLAAGGRAHVVAEVATLSSSATRQTSSGPFVPVDAGALVNAGLSGELSTQVRRGEQVLASPDVDLHTTDGTWVATAPLGQSGVDQLAPQYPHVVLPQSAVSGPVGLRTLSQPFALSSGSSASAGSSGSTGRTTAPTAVVSDAGLGAHLVAGKGANAALAAEQLVADLSFIYYEAPNLLSRGGTPAVRGVVAVAPPAWAPSAAFLSTVLTDLEGNPVVRPVTVDQLFAQVPVGADSQQAVTRRPEASTSSPAIAARTVRDARTRLTEFQSSVAGSALGSAAAEQLGDLLLASESATLPAHRQQAALTGFEAALGQQLHGLSVRSDTIRLTAGTASVPITVLRNTPYPVTVVVRLTSDKLRFPAAGTQVPGALCRSPQVQSSADRSSFSALCTLNHSTNAVYVNMQSRASGDFRIDVTLTSPQGGLVLAGGQLTVRSLSTSAVAIALSVGAGIVLLGWWGRTLWRGKGSRRGAHTVTRAGRAAT